MNREDIITGIIGGTDELALNIVSGGNVVDFRGKTTLLELAELIKRSELIVTNDSSPIHIASAWKNVRILAIFGPTVKELGFFPWSENSKVFQIEGLACNRVHFMEEINVLKNILNVCWISNLKLY